MILNHTVKRYAFVGLKQATFMVSKCDMSGL